MSEGLRERKKRQTRQRISDVAIGLFVAHGFDNVTIAEVAAAAEVSVNTVYNYFQAKEDLVLPPEEASPQRLADIVRERRPGQSAADAVLARLRQEVRGRERRLGLSEGFGRVLEMMRAAPTLTARLEQLAHQMTAELAGQLVRGDRRHARRPAAAGCRLAAREPARAWSCRRSAGGPQPASGQTLSPRKCWS